MKFSLDISNFLEEISSLSQSIVFLYFFAFITEEGFVSSPCYSLELCIQMGMRPRFNPWVGKIPWRRKWQPTLVLLPGKSHGQKSLIGYSPHGHKESDMTERLHFHFSLSLSFSPLPLASVLFSALFKASSDNYFCLFVFFPLGMVLITTSCTMSRTSIHSSSGTLPYLILWLYFSLPLYNHKGFDLGHTWMV